jgi:Gpi18-like mannosyltransferase
LLAALILGAFLLSLPYQTMPARRVEVGAEAAAGALTGFSFPEIAADGQTFRWSETGASARNLAEGTVIFPDVANRPLAIRLRLAAPRPAGEPVVTLTVNGREIGSFPAGGVFAEYAFSAGREAVGWDGDVIVGLRVPPFTAPPDTRELGAAVAWVEIVPDGGPAIPPRPALAWVLLPMLLGAAGFFWLARRFRWSAPAAAGLGVGLAALGALWVRVDGVGALHWAWLIPVGVWLTAAAFAWGPAVWRGGATRLREIRTRHPVGFWLTVIILLALAIYLPLSLTRGYEGDIAIYMAWTHQITHHGIHSAYSPDFSDRPNTTPGLLYPFRAIGEVFRRFFSPDFPSPQSDHTYQAYLRFMLRLPALICNGLIAAVVFWLVRRRWGDRMGLIAIAAYVFNPAVIFESAYYGQTGAVHALFMLLAVIGLAEGAPAAGWASLTVGMLTKPQADLFLPLFVVLTWRRYGWRGLLRSVLAAAAVALIMLAPFIAHGTLGQMWERVSHPADYHPMLSATAHNIWWLFSLGNGKASDLLMPPLLDRLGWPIFTYRFIGLGLVGLAYLLVMVRTWRDRSPETLYLSTAYLFTAFFMLATQIHENHLIPMFSLLLLACPGHRRRWLIYALFAVTATLNMALHYPQILRVLVPQNPDVWGGTEMALARWLSSLAQVSVFLYWTVVFVRETFAGVSIRKTQ